MFQMVTRIGIRWKVVAAFAAVLCCTAGLGLFAAGRLSGVNATAVDVRDNWMVSIRSLGAVAAANERIRAVDTLLLFATADRDVQDLAKRVASAHDDYARNWAAYEPTITAGEEQGLAKAITDAHAAFQLVEDKYLALQHAGERDKATAALTGDVQPAAVTLRDAIAADLGFNVREGTRATNDGVALGTSAMTWIFIVLGLTATLCVAIGWSLTRGISTPVKAMTEAMRRLADHDVATEIFGVGRGDEIGAMAAAVQVFKDNMIKADGLASEQQTERAAKDRHAGRTDALTQGFESKVGSLVGMLSSAATELEATAQSMTATAGQANQRAATVAAAAEQASAGAQTVASAAEQLTASIAEISRQVGQSAKITGKAVDDARRTDGIVRALADGAQKIGDVVALISNIAAQTNLLARFCRIP